MIISQVLLKKIQDHAKAQYPNEMCGFIVGEDFIPVNNIAADPTKEFETEPGVFLEFAGKCSAFIHSHPDWYNCPSKKDMEQQIASGLIWGIVSTDGKDASEVQFFGDQLPIPDLKTRTFVHGITDCYSGIRHWFKNNKGIWLKEIPRSWEWWLGGDDLYSDNFGPVGFKIVPHEDIAKKGPEPGDVFLAKLRSNKLNHGGIYTGNGLGFHHITAQLPVDATRIPREEPLERWVKYIDLWVRYDAPKD